MSAPLALDLGAEGTRVCVVGAGYVGLPMAMAAARAGFDVVSYDTSRERIAQLASGQSPVETIEESDLQALLAASRFHPTSDPADIQGARVALICVPTPLGPGGVPDTTYLEAAAGTLSEHLRSPCLVVVESTSFPGSTAELVLPRLRERLGRVGEDFFLACVPERIDPGSRDFALTSTPRLVGGVTERCTISASLFYRRLGIPVYAVPGPGVAEAAKLLENSFRSVNIALVNELMLLCDVLSIDVDAVIEAAATKPFGYMPFHPGPGVGGECIPVDPHYLAWLGRREGQPLPLIELALDINARMPAYAVSRLGAALNERGMALRGARILLCGVSYKANVGDMRNAPALAIIEALKRAGSRVSYFDSHVDEIHLGAERLVSTALTADVVAAQDLVAVVTRHADVDYAWLKAHAAALVDLAHARPA
jgi:UDP-N-acetyl-D-glucosamine dehydrogenase